LSEVGQDEHFVAQKYIADPFLLDGLKFDLRIYVLLFGVAPMRILLYQEGLVRLATENYVQPNDINSRNMFMHLTNYAINKFSDKFVENEEQSIDGSQIESEAHKRPLSSLWHQLKV
jgi:tubulin polyglutamylase TTLL6/13